jgi:hypothetical protein
VSRDALPRGRPRFLAIFFNFLKKKKKKKKSVVRANLAKNWSSGVDKEKTHRSQKLLQVMVNPDQ